MISKLSLSLHLPIFLYSNSQRNLLDFCNSCISHDIEVCYYEGTMRSIDHMTPILSSLLPKVKNQIYFYKCGITSDAMSAIFQSCYNATHLSLVYCDVYPLKLNPNSFYMYQKYKTHHLDLYMTCIQANSPTALNKNKLDKLLPMLAKTDLKNSLRTVHVRNCEYPPDELGKVFKSYGFNVEVTGGTKQIQCS